MVQLAIHPPWQPVAAMEGSCETRWPIVAGRREAIRHAPDVVCDADEGTSGVVACDTGGDVSTVVKELDVAGALVDSELDDDDDCFVG